jgi:UDP-N-acetyl-D-mannosaminuronic acid dehydrogenase
VRFSTDVVIVGGCGHVGLPLGLAFADRGLDVVLLDINADAVNAVNAARMPFSEPGAQEVLERVRSDGRLVATTRSDVVATAEHVVIIVGTPVDEHLNPTLHILPNAIEEIAHYLSPEQLVVLRSTVYPGVTAMVERMLHERGIPVDVAFCPERIAEGRAMAEIFELPQIVAATSPAVVDRAAKLFANLTADIVRLEPEEAELAKLFTNTWRYIKFATANQFYMIANDCGYDFEKIRGALSYNYPRARDLPQAGFAAGPCLFKDTMQLAAFNNHAFTLGHSSMMVNEGLPLYIVSRMERQLDLRNSRVGILGMAFKAESDDPRASLSYKLKRILRFKAKEVFTTDPYVTNDANLVPLETVLEHSDVLVVGAPHDRYRELNPTVPTFDIWNCLGNGVRT